MLIRNLLIVTFVDFWNKGAGHRSRLFSLISFLYDLLPITVYFVGKVDETDKVKVYQSFPLLHFEFEQEQPPSTFEEAEPLFEQFCKGKQFDFLLVEYIELSFVLRYVSSNTVTILDTHDIVHEKIISFKKYGITYDGIQLSRQEEINLFRCYDVVIFIQQLDFQKYRTHIGSERAILVPHAVSPVKSRIKKKVKNICYIGSEYAPNVTSLHWFLTDIWPSVRHRNRPIFHIYGQVCNHLNQSLVQHCSDVYCHGFINQIQDVYKSSDLIVNPILAGAGLKIKNVEALGFGLPLITTSHGATGLEDAPPETFLIADTAENFSATINSLILDYKLRTRLSENALFYSTQKFMVEKAYASLLNIIIN
ncbi:MAG: glycosyltransferase family 4 protein [Flavisolibacter sp.]